MGAIEAGLVLVGSFIVLVAIRLPVSFALALAAMPMFFFNERLNVSLMFSEMFRSYNSFLLLAVPFFLLAANLMNAARITDRLIDLSQSLVGHLPGGLAHVNVMVSMLFAGTSGSSTADAAGIGSVLIPSMRKKGYDASFSVAVTACSSVMGVVIPPSVLMVVWGGIMSVSIGGLFLAGVLPGLLLGLSMMITVLIFAKRRGYPMEARASSFRILRAMIDALLALASPVIIVGGIAGGFFTPTEASFIAVVYSLLLGVIVYRTVGLHQLWNVLYDTARFAAISLFAIGTASAFSWLLAYNQVPAVLVRELSGAALNPFTAGLLAAFAFLVTGLFIDAIPAIIILGSVLWPVMAEAGMHPVHFAIVGIVSLSFGLVTPPYGLCLLITSAIAEIPVTRALKDVSVFLLPMFFVLLLLILWPDAVLFLPRLLLPRFI